MRQIKFRAFDDGKMVYEKDIAHISMENTDILRLAKFFCNVRDDSHIMQFTGLLDKNGKAIYEGDVVRIACGYSGDHHYPECVAEMIFNEGEFCAHDYKNKWGFVGQDFSWKDDVIIIGNIYENPELVK